MSDFTFANTHQPVPAQEAIGVDFSIKASPNTDIWAKPPSTNRFNAPILYKSIPLSSFKRARVALVADWKNLYDQGGLVLVLNGPDGDRKWLKTGIEFTEGKPHISTVAKDNWADWSLLPVPSGGNAATIEMVKEQDGSLWVYFVEGITRSPVREITWIFDREEDTECWIGAYACRPSKEGGDLTVEFRHLVIELQE
jgi:regulation of enolase protein 1 (concanavalin A-like superfamily)